MMQSNPTPQSDNILYQRRIEGICTGQKLIIAATLTYILLALCLQYLDVGSASVFFISILIMAMIGMEKIVAASHLGKLTKNLLLVSIVIPPISMITLVYLNNLATAELRLAGYNVGIFGVKGNGKS